MNVLTQLHAALADRYTIEREIGRGGMATVYLARDVKHRRQVAVKVLDPELGAVLGVDRFLSEIRVTANLQHPNLLPLFDSGEASGLLFYVMPFVEGETLRHRLDRDKQLSTDEAIRIAVAIAGALDYAHRHGVVHRDLKPENILLHDGQPLVADFGIALAVSNAGGQRITQTGLSLGTPQYMSPEQATGDREIDGRTDIYSLGAIAYEMLAGEPPHLGNSAQAIIARLMTEEPRPLSAVRRSVPAHVEESVHRALEKIPADRFASAKEFADSLLGTSRSMTTRRVRGDATPTRMWRTAFWLAAAAAVLGIAAFAWAVTRPGPDMPAVRFRVDDDARPVSLFAGGGVGVSGDGMSITYVPQGYSTPQLVTRRIGDLEPTPLTGTGNLQGLSEFRYSNDGRWLAMKVGSRLLRMPSSGGAPVVVTSDVETRFDGIAVTDDGGVIYRAVGGLVLARPSTAPTPLAQADTTRGELSLRSPVVLPDGKHVVFSIAYRQRGGLTDPLFTDAARTLGTIALGGGGRRSFELVITNPIGYVDGWLVYGTAAGTINAVQFDPDDGVKGDPITVLTGVAVNFNSEVLASLSPAGTLAYTRLDVDRSIVVLDMNGIERSRLPDRGGVARPTWSPDGRRIAFDADSIMWVHDVASKASLRLTTVRGDRPAWTADGKRIGYVSAESDLWWVPADGSAKEELLHRPVGGPAREIGFTPDGRSVLFRFDQTGPAAVRLVRNIQIAAIGGAESRALVTNGYVNTQVAVSPDGRWIAYSSNETGQFEVYVRAFEGGGRVPVSIGGGTEPRWMSNTQLVYRARPRRAFWRATLSTSEGTAVVSRRDSLFADTYVTSPNNPHYYDVTRDGRFVVVRDEGQGASLVAVVNWVTELRAIIKAR